MRRLMPLLLVSLFACPAPPPTDCTRSLVDAFGLSSGGFVGGVGGGTADPEAPLGLVGRPMSLTVFAPVSACAADVLRADATVNDPDNEPVAFTMEGALTRSGQPSAVSGTFTFTPRKPGLHTVRVAFEPSLGVRSVLVDVARDGLLGATTRVPIPTGVTCTVWPLADDTVACEEAGGFVSITSVDGGLVRFPGSELVVADNVLWSIDGTSSTLERRVYEDGGVRVLNRLPAFPARATPALHDVDVALRFRANGLLTRVRIGADGGVSEGDFAVENLVSTPLAYFVEPDDTLYRISNSDCFSSPCKNLTDVVGLEPGLLWRTVGGFDGRSGVSAFERPLLVPASARFSLRRFPLTSDASPTHAFERIPFWLSTSIADRNILVAVEGAMAFSGWPRSQVLTVGRRHVLLTDAPGFVRVVKR